MVHSNGMRHAPHHGCLLASFHSRIKTGKSDCIHDGYARQHRPVLSDRADLVAIRRIARYNTGDHDPLLLFVMHSALLQHLPITRMSEEVSTIL
jgi:hypothetical protein